MKGVVLVQKHRKTARDRDGWLIYRPRLRRSTSNATSFIDSFSSRKMRSSVQRMSNRVSHYCQPCEFYRSLYEYVQCHPRTGQSLQRPVDTTIPARHTSAKTSWLRNATAHKSRRSSLRALVDGPSRVRLPTQNGHQYGEERPTFFRWRFFCFPMVLFDGNRPAAKVGKLHEYELSTVYTLYEYEV